MGKQTPDSAEKKKLGLTGTNRIGPHSPNTQLFDE